MYSPPLLALGFASLPMLAGLGAASIPVVLHLLNRRQFREVRFAAMRFLLAAIRKNQRRVRIEQWLLLAIRTLLVMLVVAAMARPFLESYIPILAGQRTHRVIVLDGSLSMGTKVGEKARFDQAKELAERLVRDARPGDPLSVVVMGDPPKVVIREPSANRDEVRKELAEVTLPHGSTDLTASFEAIARVLGSSTIPRKEVIVLSDLQAASWRKGGGPDEGLRRAIAKLETQRPHSVVIDVGKDAGTNRAITSLRVDPSLVTTGIVPSPAITVAVRNFAPSTADNVKVRLIVDGKVGPDRTISIAANAEEVVAFPYDFTAPGEHLVEARIDEDTLPLDDRRWLALPVRDAFHVLLVDGDPKAEAFRSETDFLAAALSPEADSAGVASPVKVEVGPESALGRRDLTKFDAVVLCNIARVTPGEVAALESYLKQGGGVVVFGGDRVKADNYNALLFNGGKGLLPAEIGDPVGETDGRSVPFEFNALGFRHPIVAEFAGQDPTVTAGLTRVKTARYQKLKVPRASPATVALAFDKTGDPAVVEAPRYRGRVVQVATTADTGWTTWPLHQSFPAVMLQAVTQAAAGRVGGRNVRVGQPMEQDLPASAAGAPASIRRPDGRTVPAKVAAAGDVAQLRFEETDIEGPYQVKLGAPANLDSTYAANPDPAESDPRKLDRAGLAEALPGWNFDYRADASSLMNSTASVGRRGELHRPLLWGVLALLLIEAALAWRFGHHPTRG